MSEEQHTQCGYVAIIGRPNVGKSTLLNFILGQKISITSRKPQTTRHQFLGVSTQGNIQAIYVDTPGMIQQSKDALQRSMQRAAQSVLNDVDVILWVVEAGKWTAVDAWMQTLVAKIEVPIILVINKIDKLSDKKLLLPYIQDVQQHANFQSILPIAAKHGTGIELVSETVTQFLPLAAHLFEADQITDRSERFIVCEMIREKIMRYTGAEVPYGVTVTLDTFESKPHITDISATIWANRPGHKRILIGEKGAMLKRIGQAAREDIERLLDQKVMLRLWVKVKENWIQKSDLLGSLGYN